MDTFKVGDEVRWTSQSAGYVREKLGVVVLVVPAGARPATVARVRGVPISNGIFVRAPRDHESYVVRARQQNGRKRPATYWPLVNKLERAQARTEGD